MTLKHLSPSGLSTFEKNREEFYIRYVAEHKPPRPAQTAPMSIGSAFDAFVKSYIHHALFGNDGGGVYDLESLFEDQVAEEHRDTAWDAAVELFGRYRKCGAMADLMVELQTSASEPRFEFEIKGEVSGMTLLGKPDLFFVNRYGSHVILDWKVNGYYSKSNTSPAPGYVKIRDTWTGMDGIKQGRNNMLPHPKAEIIEHNGLQINAQYLNDCQSYWADQLATYAWLLGAPIGSENLIVGIEQIVCNGIKTRVASHRSRIEQEYQEALVDRYRAAWEYGNNTVDPTLEKKAKALSSDDPFTQFVNQESRKNVF